LHGRCLWIALRHAHGHPLLHHLQRGASELGFTWKLAGASVGQRALGKRRWRNSASMETAEEASRAAGAQRTAWVGAGEAEENSTPRRVDERRRWRLRAASGVSGGELWSAAYRC
jgi:hypothetical protein